MPLPTLLIKGKLANKNLESYVPIEYIISWLKNKLTLTGITNRVLILLSKTASGKSTLLPPAIYKTFKNNRGIICTQPRVLTTIENVRVMLKHNKDLILGHNIGWSTKYNKLRPKKFGLLSATIGTLTAQLSTYSDDEIAAMYSVIMIDETHERELNTDMTIYMLKNFLLRYGDKPDCPMVIFMSATFDPRPFLDYFNLPDDNFIDVSGETAHVAEHWDWNESRTVSDYTRAAADVTRMIIDANPHESPSTADILIFMPGKKEFEETSKWLQLLNEEMYKKHKVAFSLLLIDGDAVRMQNRDYRYLSYVPIEKQTVLVGKKHVTPSRRVIISTNVAETGLTLENLRYVIDSGYNREVEYNPIYDTYGLITKPAPQSRITQRRGRAGRSFEGDFYPLYPLWIYERLPKLQLPQIITEDISRIYLGIINEQLKTRDHFDVKSVDMITTPTPDATSTALDKLYLLGLIHIDEQCKITLTQYGKYAHVVGGRPEIARMVLASFTYDASAIDCITAGAWLTLRKPKNILWGHVYQAGLSIIASNIKHMYEIKLMVSDDFIDGIIMMNAIKYIFKTNEPRDAIKALRTWTERIKWKYTDALDFIKIREDMINTYLSESYDLFRNNKYALSEATPETFINTIVKLKYCIADGFRCNLLTHENYVSGNHDTASAYIPAIYKTRLGAQVMVHNFMPDDQIKTKLLPKRILYSTLSLKLAKSGIYNIIPDYISVLDGYVPIDDNFAS